MAISWLIVANSIAALSGDIAGVTIKRPDEILDKVTTRDTPVMMLAPSPISDIVPEVVALGTGSTKRLNVEYTLNYRFFYQKVGANRKLKDVFDGLMTKLGLTVDVLLINDVVAGALDLQIVGITGGPVVVDPINESFFGYDIALRILEFEDG